MARGSRSCIRGAKNAPDRDGLFARTGLVPDRYLVAAIAGGLVSQPETVDVAPAAAEAGDVLVDRVLDSKDTAVAGALVTAQPVGDDPRDIPGRCAKSNASRWSTIRDLPGGEYSLGARKEGFVGSSPVVTTLQQRTRGRRS